MNVFKLFLLGSCLFLNVSFIQGQSNIKSYQFKKGEILDILLLSTKPEGKALFDKYKKTAFPVAMALSYQPQPGFAIAANLRGNLHPEQFLFGKWENVAKREKFLTDIIGQVPDFHQQRNAIWSIFNLTYYEMEEDLNFSINKEKFNVVTAYWQKEAWDFQRFKKQWNKQSQLAGGKPILELANGKSPFAYFYQPDYLVITQWENQAAFEAFRLEQSKLDQKGVRHINQFSIQ